MKRLFGCFLAFVLVLSTTVASQSSVGNPQRLAAIERAIEEQVTSHPSGAEKLLASYKKEFGRAVHISPVNVVTEMSRTLSALSRLGGNKITLKVVKDSHPLVEGGFAAMVVDDVVYTTSRLETASEQDLFAILAHELSHDRIDVVRKRLFQEVADITPEEISWLNTRLEARAHLGAVKRLSQHGFDPESMLTYVKGMKLGILTKEQKAYTEIAISSALMDMRQTTGGGGR